MEKAIRMRCRTKRISSEAFIYLSAAMEAIVIHLLAQADQHRNERRVRITSSNVLAALKENDVPSELTVRKGGYVSKK